MRCLYCGKELALLKRWTGGGDFCSDAHKQSYQEEYNRLALSRLLQAQKKGQQGGNSPAQNGAPPPAIPVAVEEPAEEEVAFSTDVVSIPAAESPVFAVAHTEEMAEAAMDAVAVEEASAEEVADAEPSVGAEPEPLESAGFLLESPAMAALAEDSPYLEPWLELSTGPAMAEWQLQNGSFSLSPADLLVLELRPKAASIGHPAPSADLSPWASDSTHVDPSFPPKVRNTTQKLATMSRLPAGGSIAIDVAARPVASETDARLVEAVGFESMVLFDSSQLLDLSPTAIDFPTEDSDVVVLARSPYNSVAADFPALDVTPLEGELEPAAEDNTPRASLEALSRLHQELVEQEAARIPEAAHIPEVSTVIPEVSRANETLLAAQPLQLEPAQVVDAVAIEVVGPSEMRDVPEAIGETIEITPEQTKPGYTSELFEISIKTFPPAKPTLIGGDALPSHVAPHLPHLKALPLRPKIALATGYVPPAKASALSASSTSSTLETKPAETKPAEIKPAESKATPAAPSVRTQNPGKPTAVGKPATRLAQPKQPPQPVKPTQPAASKAAEPRAPEPVKAEPAKAEAAQQVAKVAASQSTPAQEATAAKPSITDAPPRTPAADEDQAPKPAPEQPVKPAAKRSSGQTSGKQADAVNSKTDQTKKDAVPNFGVSPSAKVPFAGSLKVKLGIAIVLLVAACTTYLGWGSKSHKPANSNSAVSTDGSGPSIIMGEGGWVEGWGGDPNGMHTGRQITIYRPSLNLSDYRLEFQGSIDTKSVGWVFRASDPGNYYAMKLMTVSSGLSPKVALFKYLVANGKQTQVGRVPIDLAVQEDTVFKVRVDVRGPQFSTFIQGQQVDVWTDDQLKTGGVGFLNEREERGKVKSVSIRYLSGGAK